MNEEAVRDRIKKLITKHGEKLASSLVGIDLEAIEHDSSIAPNIQRPEPVFMPIPEPDPWGMETDDTASATEASDTRSPEFNYAKSLKNHSLFKEPASIKHLTEHLYASFLPEDEPLQLISSNMHPDELMALPSAEELRRVSLDSTTVQMIKEGRVAMQQDNWLRAFQLFNKALEVDPNCHRASAGLALAYLNEGNLDKAIENFTRAREVDSVSVYYKEKLYNTCILRAQE